MSKQQIIFKNITFDGKRQKKLIKMFDLMDEFFDDAQKENMETSYFGCTFKNFNIDGKTLKKGSTAYNLFKMLLDQKTIEVI